jgi:hypothetical protein
MKSPVQPAWTGRAGSKTVVLASGHVQAGSWTARQATA